MSSTAEIAVEVSSAELPDVQANEFAEIRVSHGESEGHAVSQVPGPKALWAQNMKFDYDGVIVEFVINVASLIIGKAKYDISELLNKSKEEAEKGIDKEIKLDDNKGKILIKVYLTHPPPDNPKFFALLVEFVKFSAPQTVKEMALNFLLDGVTMNYGKSVVDETSSLFKFKRGQYVKEYADEKELEIICLDATSNSILCRVMVNLWDQRRLGSGWRSGSLQLMDETTNKGVAILTLSTDFWDPEIAPQSQPALSSDELHKMRLPSPSPSQGTYIILPDEHDPNAESPFSQGAENDVMKTEPKSFGSSPASGQRIAVPPKKANPLTPLTNIEKEAQNVLELAAAVQECCPKEKIANEVAKVRDDVAEIKRLSDLARSPRARSTISPRDIEKAVQRKNRAKKRLNDLLKELADAVSSEAKNFMSDIESASALVDDCLAEQLDVAPQKLIVDDAMAQAKAALGASKPIQEQLNASPNSPVDVPKTLELIKSLSDRKNNLQSVREGAVNAALTAVRSDGFKKRCKMSQVMISSNKTAAGDIAATKDPDFAADTNASLNAINGAAISCDKLILQAAQAQKDADNAVDIPQARRAFQTGLDACEKAQDCAADATEELRSLSGGQTPRHMPGQSRNSGAPSTPGEKREVFLYAGFRDEKTPRNSSKMFDRFKPLKLSGNDTSGRNASPTPKSFPGVQPAQVDNTTFDAPTLVTPIDAADTPRSQSTQQKKAIPNQPSPSSPRLSSDPREAPPMQCCYPLPFSVR